MSSTDARSTRVKWRKYIALFVPMVLILTAVIAVVSQKDPGEPQERQVAEVTRLSAPPRKYPARTVTLNANGETVVRDDATGQTRDLTPEEQRRLAAGLVQMINKSTDGLVQMRYADGSVSIDLDGHFESVMMAKVEPDGSVTTACSDDLDTAAAFFKIDTPIVQDALRRVATARGRLRPGVQR